MLPTFTLEDIPDDWQVRLNDDFVEELDRANRPWVHNPDKKRGKAQYWEAGELHKRTLNNMTEEEVRGYKRRHSFFEKLWGRHRYKDYHYPKGDPRRHVNTGPWIDKEETAVLREGVSIDEENLNKAITGFRIGKFSDNVREMRIEQLPITADENWAWMLGFYFGAGNMFLYEREGYESIYIRIRIEDPVLPRFLEVADRLGMHAVKYEIKRKYLGTKDTDRLGVGTRDHIVFGWPEFVVLKKFGLPTQILDEVEDREQRQLAAAGYKPEIPDWILGNDRFMRSFIEGYISTPKGVSTLQPVPMASNKQRSLPRMEVRITGNGYPEEYINKFMQAIYAWFEEHGVTPGYYDAPPAGKNRAKPTIYLIDRDAWAFLREEFDLYRPALRTRLNIRLEAEQNPVIYEALRRLERPENIILGCLLEQPTTAEEVAYDLRMYQESAETALQNLVETGLATQEGTHYRYDPEEFIPKIVDRYRSLAEDKQEKMREYAETLLYQCQECRQVYLRPHETCGICNGVVTPVPRGQILGRLSRQRRYDLYLAEKLEKEGEK